jgi:endonuclease III
MTRIPLEHALSRLEALYGPQIPPSRDPWLLILWENVAYLANDERRTQAFGMLKKEIGTSPEEILEASDEALLEVTRHGIVAEKFAQKLRKCAQILLEEFDGELAGVLRLPVAKAKKALRRFPGIGAPGAEKILTIAGIQPILALESNGLRVLSRLGYGEESSSYDATYRSVQVDASNEAVRDCEWLTRAYLLLRRHGQETCRRNQPQCENCPLAADCPSKGTREPAKW